jgi:hypothetical protein
MVGLAKTSLVESITGNAAALKCILPSTPDSPTVHSPKVTTRAAPPVSIKRHPALNSSISSNTIESIDRVQSSFVATAVSPSTMPMSIDLVNGTSNIVDTFALIDKALLEADHLLELI